MTELTIDRLTATAVANSDDRAGTESRISTLLQHVAASRLDAALAEVALPQGYWCVRRLDVALALDFDRSDAALETQWSRALVDAVAAALADRSGGLVFYPRIVDALIDFLTSAVRHDDGHEWAWRQVGLLSPADRGVGEAGRDQARLVLAALGRHPRDAIAAVAACVRAMGATSLHRVLGATGWTELASIALGALGGSTRIAPGVTGLPDGPALRTVAVESFPAQHPGRPAERSAALAGDVVGRSVLAAALARMSIRVERPLAWAWAVIAIAEAAPSVLLRTDSDTVIAVVADHFIRSEDRAAPGFLGADRRSEAAAFDATPPATESGNCEPAAADADRDEPAQTLWAGALFFLNTAADAGIPDEFFTDPVLAGCPLWRILGALIQAMVPISAGDPTLLALCGPPRPAEPLTDEEQGRVETYASRWLAVTAERMDVTDEDPADVCMRVALRRGSIVAEPGWIDVHLDLDDVDIDVRRAGLDLDPGWIPWLGCVVRFCYD
ncbi:hypothetical protein [Mycobacterium sp. DL99]|uniref:hypothetical protein n=1 Tax=Mycobacterium sp. DL99 TaxID=2528957 RepID=UPI0014369653|nr:hypothetical protein [Mycobacterium sp. DL99]